MEEEKNIGVDLKCLIGNHVKIGIKHNTREGYFFYTGTIKYVNDKFLFLIKDPDKKMIVLNLNRILEIR